MIAAIATDKFWIMRRVIAARKRGVLSIQLPTDDAKTAVETAIARP